eukprot:1379911-Rhodomonas_salina.2
MTRREVVESSGFGANRCVWCVRLWRGMVPAVAIVLALKLVTGAAAATSAQESAQRIRSGIRHGVRTRHPKQGRLWASDPRERVLAGPARCSRAPGRQCRRPGGSNPRLA